MQLCLRITALFVDCDDTDILDMHVNPPAPQACQEQPLLVEDLAEALWSYEYECIRRECLHQTIEQGLNDILGNVTDTLMAYELLRRKRALPDQAASVSRAERLRLYTTMRHVVEALKGVSPDTWHWYARRRTLQSQRLLRLCDRMRAALRRYGPREWYPAAAHYQAIAHILRAFKVEEGQEDTVAARVRKRLDRLDRSQHSPPQD